jgi:branched-chain amino acid aminotransferase
MTVGLKILSYAENVMALVEAGRAGADDAIVLDTEGHCCEGAFSNLFICRAGTLVTPPTSCGALPGITRQAVLEFASGLALPTVERPFFPAELLAADEAFLTSSLRGIAPLVTVDGQAVGSGAPGPVTARVRDAYAELVMRECGVASTS